VRTHQGPNLPYSVIAGAAPTDLGWLVASAKLHGATFAPEEIRIFELFREVLDIRPSLEVLVVNVPIGLADVAPESERSCDRAARALLGSDASMMRVAPSRDELIASVERGERGRFSAHDALMLRYLEVSREMSPYRQRVVYEGHPELSYFQLNGDEPLRWSIDSDAGLEERRGVLERKIPGVSRLFEVGELEVRTRELYDVAALLWTARRVFGHSAKRLPEDAVWDSEGLRMELVM
jgi:predicted RNase H-like nuclease